ncbi:MAG: hypothetical protein ACI9G1_001397 [Pirellulaceae bacterium]|jgi:hypothetical protein
MALAKPEKWWFFSLGFVLEVLGKIDPGETGLSTADPLWAKDDGPKTTGQRRRSRMRGA